MASARSISSCGTDGQALVRHLCAAHKEDKLKQPPQYVFVFNDEKIAWSDAVVSWTMFYREAPNIDFDEIVDRKDVQFLLDRVKGSGFGELRYFRWDERRNNYLTYVGNDAKR